MTGWVVNDTLSPLPGQHTIFSDLLRWFSDLRELTNSGLYCGLPERVEFEFQKTPVAMRPDYIIRNATYFRPLRFEIPTVSFLQDVAFGLERVQQIDVCRRSTKVVTNSDFTASEYPELDDVEVIPIGVDTERFRPSPISPTALQRKWGILPDSICFVGSGHHVKGFQLLVNLIANTRLNYCLVFKDDQRVENPRVRCFNRLNPDELAEVMSACVAGICTSLRETQHMAGLEMGMCGLPLLTTNVGAYWNRESGPWGMSVEDFELLKALPAWMKVAVECDLAQRRAEARSYWINEGFTQKACRDRWAAVLDSVVRRGSGGGTSEGV